MGGPRVACADDAPDALVQSAANRTARQEMTMDAKVKKKAEGGCPVVHGGGQRARTNRDWWPGRLRL